MTNLSLVVRDETYGSLANSVSTVIESGQHNRTQFDNLYLAKRRGGRP